MDDDEYLDSLVLKASSYDYHDICTWLPYKPETIDDIAHDIAHNGYREDRPIMLFEGKILDGRHRYEAALKVGVEPTYVNFNGTEQEAIDYVTSENVNRRHLNNQEKEFFYFQRAEALGVRTKADNQHTPTGVSIPTQEEHADALGVGQRTVSRWEKDRKDMKADQNTSEDLNTFEGFKKAKQKLKEKRNEAKEKIQNSVPPNVVDLNAIAKDTKNTDLQNVGPAFIALMEKLCSKFDDSDIKKELSAFMYPDPIGLKVDALHKMTNILTDLCVDFPVKKLKNLN